MKHVNLFLASTMLVGCVGGDLDDLETTESAVINGSFEPDYLYPWQLRVEGCGATLIADRWALTAAHCIEDDELHSGVRVELRRTGPDGAVIDDMQNTGIRSVFIPAAWFTDESTTNDIALIKLHHAFPPTPWLQRAELPLSLGAIGTPALVASLQSHPGPTPVGQVAVMRAPIIAARIEELTTLSEETGLCGADSGSGLITTAGGINFVVGIASEVQSSSCTTGGFRAFYTPVHSHLAFIRARMGLDGGTFQPAPADYDGDERTDIAGKFAGTGDWRIDLSGNGFGAWDLSYPGYGNATARPVPADYDGDGYADLAVLGSDGTWLVNYSYNGLAGGWDDDFSGYGFSDAIPVPGYYDSDTQADFATKDSGGNWNIDYSSDGFGAYVSYWGFGPATWLPAPGDYDGDTITDLAIKTPTGQFRIDYSSVYGFGTIDAIFVGYGGSASTPAPADYDNDQITDLAVRDTSVGFGTWRIDYSTENGFGLWNSERSGYGTGGTLTQGDYDGDGSADWSIAGDGTWFVDHAASKYDGWNVIQPIPF